MLPVPPLHYGGIERIIDMLAREYVSRGHEVALFAHRDSGTVGALTPWVDTDYRLKATARNAFTLQRALAEHPVDVVHSFARVATLALLLRAPIPKLMTYQRPIAPRTIRWAHRISGGTLEFCAISRWMYQHVAQLGRWHMVPNGVPLETYTFTDRVADDAPLVFLGRIEEIKGPHLAIALAKRTGRRLVIAGNIPVGFEGWFDQHVAPHIDGEVIRYVGPVDDVAKNALLGQAAAFLMPILWDEPFGIVMAEAMACGTPVIGLSRGAVPEVVVDGETGYVRECAEELDDAVRSLHRISRAACRARVEAHYSGTALAGAYLGLYQAMLNRGNSR